MASLHQSPPSLIWYACYTDAAGKRHHRSTHTTRRRDALKIAAAWQLAVDHARANRLSPDRARAVIAEGVEAIFAASSGSSLPRSTVHDFLEQWLETRQHNLAPASLTRYAIACARFIQWLDRPPSTSHRPLSTVTRRTITDFNAFLLANRSPNTARVCVKVLHAAFASAILDGLLTSNPAAAIAIPRTPGSSCRPFTSDELRSVFETAQGEWLGICLFGYYTGQRLGDIYRVTGNQLDTVQWTWKFCTAKTGKPMILPLAKAVQDYITDHLDHDAPNAPLFPRAARSTISRVSHEFTDILINAGLVRTRGPSGRSEITFHSFRHQNTSILAALGVGAAVSQSLVGHDSPLIHQHYTHINLDTLRAAVARIPEPR